MAYHNLVEAWKFLVKAKVRVDYFILATFLSLTAAIVEGISVGVLVVLANGVIVMDFKPVGKFPILKDVISIFSGKSTLNNSGIFILLVGMVFIAAVFKHALQYVSGILVSSQIRKISNSIRCMIFERYLNFGKLFFDRNNVGSLHNILINFTNQIVGQLAGMQDILGQAFMLIIYLTIMFTLSWKLTLIVLVIFPVLSYSMEFFITKIRNTSLRHSDAYNALSSNISNILSCIPLVKLYSREKEEVGHFTYLSSNIENIEFSMDKKRSMITPLQEIIVLIFILFLITVMSFMVAKEKSIQIGSCLVFFYLLRATQRSFGCLNMQKIYWASVKGALLAVFSVFNDKDKFFIPSGNKEFISLKNEIKFNHLSFSYLNGRQVLKDLNASIKKGEVTAIVGPTGVGKSTLINLILRFYDCPPSHIMIDGIDIRDFSTGSLMAHMALVGQDPLLFNDTIRNNICYGLEEVSEDRIIDAIKKARLYDFIKTLNDGLDTYIGDKGVRLSGGEKQRVAIARALLKGCEILILDEATSSLDTRTEKLIQEAIDEVVCDKTAIVIAHRLSTIKNADKIIVLQEGSIVEEGSLAELLEKRGRFYECWQEQKF